MKWLVALATLAMADDRQAQGQLRNRVALFLHVSLQSRFISVMSILLYQTISEVPPFKLALAYC